MTRKPKFLLLKNYLTVARASVGSPMFRKLYYEIGERETEVLRDGDLSCAVFVSTILKIFSLVPKIHTTVKWTVAGMKRAGWQPIKKPRPGAVIVYGPKKFKSGETHKHVGIYVGNGKAVSNSSKNRSPKIHKWNYRPVEEILWNNKLGRK